MKAIQIATAGGPEVLKLAELPDPQAVAGEAVVKIHCAGLNYIDIYQRKGVYPKKLPYIPGLEASGVVESIAPDVTTVQVGDRVAYSSQPGAYAEKCAVTADSLVKLPDDVTFEQGAAYPLQGMTAHYLLHEFHNINTGDIVVIHAAAGGMGLLLTQWAKHLGARVIGTTSTEEKALIAKDAGADNVIVYTQEDWVEMVDRLTAGAGADVIIDGVGKTTFPGDLLAAKVRGKIVIFGSASGPADPIGPNELQKRSITVCGGSLFNYLLTREELEMRANAVLTAVRAGWLKLRIEHAFPLAEAAQAHELLESRKSVGKIILRVS